MALNTAHLADFCNEGCQLSTRLSLSGQDWHLNLLVSMNEAAKLSMKHFFQSIAHGLETALVVSGERLLSCKNKDFITWKLVRQSILQLLHLCTMEVCTPVTKEPENARPSTKIPIFYPLHVASLPAQQSRAATDENGPISWAERPPHQPHRRTAYAIWRDCRLGIPSTASATRLLWNPVVTCCNSSGKVCTWTLPRRSRPQCPATIDSVDKEPHHPPGGMSYFRSSSSRCNEIQWDGECYACMLYLQAVMLRCLFSRHQDYPSSINRRCIALVASQLHRLQTLHPGIPDVHLSRPQAMPKKCLNNGIYSGSVNGRYYLNTRTCTDA